MEAAGLQSGFHDRMKVQRAVEEMRNNGRAAGIALEALNKHGSGDGAPAAAGPSTLERWEKAYKAASKSSGG